MIIILFSLFYFVCYSRILSCTYQPEYVFQSPFNILFESYGFCFYVFNSTLPKVSLEQRANKQASTIGANYPANMKRSGRNAAKHCHYQAVFTQ